MVHRAASESPRERPATSDSGLGLTAFVLSVIGVGLSTYMTIAHFTEAAILACAGGGELSCTAVTTSPQSRLFGIPVVLIGLGYFIAMSVLTAPPLWSSDVRSVALSRTGLAVVGVVFVLWLVAAEVIIIGHICLWCTGVHLVALAILLVLTRSTPSRLGFGRSAAD
ncbi:MAG: vitamin K epoxide reductase family protein [Acidobacteria bacterium]|nr:vitamin K epoxide reductase family protein [Acidobacteriota bacterium]